MHHYIESSHGKGQSDGLGACVKKKFWWFGEKRCLSGANTKQEESINHRIKYVPYKEVTQAAPKNVKK